MVFKKTILSVFCGLLIATSSVHAQTVERNYVLVAPSCLINNSGITYQVLSSSGNLLLINVSETGFKQLITAKSHHTTPCGGFLNVTNFYKIEHKKSPDAFLKQYLKSSAIKSSKTTYDIRYAQTVNMLLKQLNPQEIWKNLTTLSNFTDRYAGSNNGVAAATWIKNQVEQMAKDNHRTDVTAYFVKTGGYMQPSVVVKMGESKEPGIVVGAHMDTLESFWGNMPGADDDGSGTVTTLEVARTLLSSGIHFKKPIYFIWYSAEEEGLVGSQYVVADFKAKHIPVDAVIHMDMTGYANQNDPTIWLIQDNTNSELTRFLETLTNAYVNQPVKYTSCGYACSDHATWTQNGFKAAMPFEAAFGKDDPNIHTAQDTMDSLSLNHITDFTKLGVAFAVELAEPVG